MKILYVFMLSTFISFAQEVKQDNVTDVLSEETLINTVLVSLNIDQSSTSFIVSKISPNNPEESIIIIPEVVIDEDETSDKLNSNIVIVNNATGKIINTYFESEKTNGWVSDAVFIYEITVDTLNLKLNNSKNAFGVITKFKSNSQPNPYYYETISLFTKENKSLKKILDSHPIYESIGEVNVNNCYSNIKNTAAKLMMGNLLTNGFHDILIKHTNIQMNHLEDENGDCNPIEKNISTKNMILKFDGNVYNETRSIVHATIDSVSISEIKGLSDLKYTTIFEYYKHEKNDEVDIWSDKMFGRCCSEADLSYSELLNFEITANTNNTDYPYPNLSDRSYSTAFAFTEEENIKIILKLNRNIDNDWHESQINLTVDQVLKPNDILLKPFKLSLVNGYVKSEKTFKENGRVKEIEVFLNNNYQGTIKLLDTPLVQEFSLDFTFSKNDIVQFIPISYYNGTKFNDICLSEIQSSLAHITHASINKQYKVRELWKIGQSLLKK